MLMIAMFLFVGGCLVQSVTTIVVAVHLFPLWLPCAVFLVDLCWHHMTRAPNATQLQTSMRREGGFSRGCGVLP